MPCGLTAAWVRGPSPAGLEGRREQGKEEICLSVSQPPEDHNTLGPVPLSEVTWHPK